MRSLNQFREALRRGDRNVRLLVPTTTLEQHLQNQLAREGFVFRRSLIQTLSRFIQPWAADLPEVPEPTLYLIVETAARRVRRPEFARVVDFPGFCAALTRTIGEFSSAGCDAVRLARHLPDAPLPAAFLAVYREVERELAERGLWLRARRLELAAERIQADGAGGIERVWLEGFHALPDPELKLLAALRGHAAVTVAEVERAGNPVVAVVRAPNIEREAEEIARRILEQASAGRPFREMAMVVRLAENYVPILRSTLERFGIPARFYFDSRLEEHGAIRYLTGAVDAMLGGWDHAATVAVLRLAPRFADSRTLDRFDFLVREQIPNAGLDALRALCATAEKMLPQIDWLAALEEWRDASRVPGDWAVVLRGLRKLFRPSAAGADDHVLSLVRRGQAEALDAFDEALDESAAALDPAAAITLETFWRAVKAVLRVKPLRVEDNRRNVVHVLSAPEARQWRVPVIFICGLVEKQFPQFHRQEPFFPEPARARLNAAGIRVRTAAEFDREERALFDTAISRATVLATLSYPEFDARGDRNLPSLYLESVQADVQDARAVRPKPRSTPRPVSPVEIRDPALLAFLRERTARVSPSGLESYLQCPFQYFGRKVLRLKSAPVRPEERLDFLTQGIVVHEVLARWWGGGLELESLFEEVFARVCGEEHIPRAYHTERLRNAMVLNLAAFVRGQTPDPAARVEQEFKFALDESTEVHGKIDRLDILAEGGACVIDYKYSASVKARRDDPNLLQAPLYLLGAERHFGLAPRAMRYIGLKGGIDVVEWDSPFPEGFLEDALSKTKRAVEEIRAGRIAAEPSDPDRCRYCDYRDACRIETREPAAAAEGA